MGFVRDETLVINTLNREQVIKGVPVAHIDARGWFQQTIANLNATHGWYGYVILFGRESQPTITITNLLQVSMFCGLFCNVHNSQHSQPIFVHLFVCVCVCVFFSRVLFGSANQDESGHGVVHIHVRKDKETFQFSYPRALPGEKLNLVVRSVKKDKFKKKEAGVLVMTSSREALGSFFFLFVCFQWAHIKHVDIAQKNPKESMRTSLETTVERFSPVNSLGRNLPWVTSLGEFTYKFL